MLGQGLFYSQTMLHKKTVGLKKDYSGFFLLIFD